MNPFKVGDQMIAKTACEDVEVGSTYECVEICSTDGQLVIFRDDNGDVRSWPYYRFEEPQRPDPTFYVVEVSDPGFAMTREAAVELAERNALEWPGQRFLVAELAGATVHTARMSVSTLRL